MLYVYVIFIFMLYLILGTSKMTVEINFLKKELEMEKSFHSDLSSKKNLKFPTNESVALNSSTFPKTIP